MKSSLFDTGHFWASDPMTPFKAFIASSEFVELGRRVPAYRDPEKKAQPLRPATIQVYTLMFGKFHRWMRDHGKRSIRSLMTTSCNFSIVGRPTKPGSRNNSRARYG